QRLELIAERHPRQGQRGHESPSGHGVFHGSMLSRRSAMRQVHLCGAAPYVERMTATPAFLDSARPEVPDIVVPRGVTPFHLPGRPVRGRLVRLGALADALLTRHDNHPTVTTL